MAFRRKGPPPPGRGAPTELQTAAAKMSASDPDAFSIAQEVVKDWLEHYPVLAQRAGESDGGANGATRLLVEAFSAITALKDSLANGSPDDAEALFNTNIEIAQDQARTGVTKQWVVAFMMVRCIATSYQLFMMGRREAADNFRALYDEWSAGMPHG